MGVGQNVGVGLNVGVGQNVRVGQNVGVGQELELIYNKCIMKMYVDSLWIQILFHICVRNDMADF